MCSEVRIAWKSEVSVEGCETRVAHTGKMDLDCEDTYR